ncbi:hypothetical protein FACS189487_11260 [Campylobacterota bacterium]|nr:hypothetical protein FACS189487_11260 [Campylobacterota bacterium]
MKALLLSALFAVSAHAGAPSIPPTIDRATFPKFLKSIGAPDSPYFDYVFRWYEVQQKSALPAQVNQDPDKLYVSVTAPLAEAVKVEAAGDAEQGTTYGLETYGILDAPINTVLETFLFRWGKPVGKANGVTHPNDTVFGKREEKLDVEWGPGNFKTYTKKTNGGIANDENDSFALLLRGDATSGYALVGAFIAPIGETTTTSYITIIYIKPTADGKTEYRVAGMLGGQSYAFFGLDNGRKNFGFNVSRIREGQKDFYSQVKALKETGKIPEKQ